MSISISAIVLTKNEEENLPACLATLTWADEVLVVDSISDDATVEVAKRAGARVIEHPFTDFASQHNFAQSQATHDWVLFIDADERVSDELRDEIQALARTAELDKMNAYHIQRVHLFSGKWFPNPATRKVTPKLRAQLRRREVPRLINRTKAHWERPLHEEVRVSDPLGVLDGIIYHYSTTNLSATFESFNHYTDREAAYLQSAHPHVSVLEAIFRGLRSFVFQYFVWGMCQYGEQGLLLSIYLGMSKFMNYAKLSERLRIQADKGIWTEQDRLLLKRYASSDSDSTTR